MTGRGARLGAGLGLALVLAVALAARLAPAAEAFASGAFAPADGDTLYHLRRMRLVLAAWPAVPARDPLTAWPRGGAIPWAPGLDVAGAGAMAAGRALGGPGAGEVSVALLHLALSLAVVLLAAELTWRLVPGSTARLPAALAAGLLAALVPAGVASGRFGLVDHHVAEALMSLGLARWALAAEPEAGTPRRRRLLHEAAIAALASAAVLVFTGAPLYLALALPLSAAAVLAAPRPALLGSGAPGLALAAALAAAGTAPLVAEHGRAWTFGFPSWLQPALLAAAALGLALAVLAARLAPAAGAWRRAGLAALIGAGGVAVAWLAVPGAAGEVGRGLEGWLLRRDPWLAAVDEFQPVWRGGAGGALAAIRHHLGLPGLLLPVAAPLAVLAVREDGGRLRRALGVAWLLLSIWALSLLQVRFSRVAAPWLGVGLGLALAWLAGRAGRVAARAARWLPLAAAAGLALADPDLRAALAPPPAGPGLDPGAELGHPGAELGHPGAELGLHPGVELGLDLATWPVDPAAPGALTPWDLGHHALVLGGRPVVVNGFGSYPDLGAFEDADAVFRGPEQLLLSVAAIRRVGVVVAGAANLVGRVGVPGHPLPFQGRGFDAAWLRGVPSAPLLLGGSGVPALGVRHAEHLLPRFASTRATGPVEPPLPVVWGYEIVAGARLGGAAPPGARVILEVPLLEHGRGHVWRAAADAGADGRWTLTVPLPTDLATPTVTTAQGRLRVADGPPRPVTIPLEAVRAGRAVPLDAAPP